MKHLAVLWLFLLPFWKDIQAQTGNGGSPPAPAVPGYRVVEYQTNKKYRIQYTGGKLVVTDTSGKETSFQIMSLEIIVIQEGLTVLNKRLIGGFADLQTQIIMSKIKRGSKILFEDVIVSTQPGKPPVQGLVQGLHLVKL